MPVKTHKREREQRAVTTTGIRAASLDRFKSLAGQNRMPSVDFLDCLLDAWETLTSEQQMGVIRRQPELATSSK